MELRLADLTLHRNKIFIASAKALKHSFRSNTKIKFATKRDALVLNLTTLSIATLSIKTLCIRNLQAECFYGECHRAQCH
jgi:hypothetical protein